MADRQLTAVQLLEWRPVTESDPEPCKTVFLYRAGDLYPVTGWRRVEGIGSGWILEEGGAEDDDSRLYPPLLWTPTHFAPLHPNLPGTTP